MSEPHHVQFFLWTCKTQAVQIFHLAIVKYVNMSKISIYTPVEWN